MRSMSSRLGVVLPVLHLTRLALVFTAVSNAWLIVFFAYELEPAGRVNPQLASMPLGVALGLTAMVAVGLHTYGIALNDLLDARHDRLFSPHRPIPAGRISLTTAVTIALLSLLAGLAAVIPLGGHALMLGLVTAAAILLFNVTGKFFPAVGILMLGLIRAAHMVLPNPPMSFLYPVWLTMTHVVFTWAVAHQVEGKRPRLGQVGWAVLLGGWAFWTLVMARWAGWRAIPLTLPVWTWLLPILAAGVFVLLALRILIPAWGEARAMRDAGGRFMRLALLWLIVYDACWLLGGGWLWQGAVHLGLLAGAFISMRLLRLLALLTDAPTPPYRVAPTPRR